MAPESDEPDESNKGEGEGYFHNLVGHTQEIRLEKWCQGNKGIGLLAIPIAFPSVTLLPSVISMTFIPNKEEKNERGSYNN